jgi:TonB family protein
MGIGFKRVFSIVASVHIVLLVSLLIVPGCKRWWQQRMQEPVIMEFEVDVSVLEQSDTAVTDVVEPAPEPEPEPEPEPAPEPEPQPPPRPTIQKGPRIVRQSNSSGPTLTAEEVKRLLEQGAKAGTRNVIPGEDGRCFAMIKRSADQAWEKPSYAAVGDAEVEVALWFDAAGRVTRSEVSKPSGVAALDDSVRQMLTHLKTVPGLTRGFIERHPRVTVGFRVEE